MNIRPEIHRGIELLDRLGPKDWRQKIDFSTLSMGSLNQCILGQTFGDYCSGKVLLCIESGAKYGFDLYRDDRSTYIGLASEWKLILSQDAADRAIAAETAAMEAVAADLTWEEPEAANIEAAEPELQLT